MIKKSLVNMFLSVAQGRPAQDRRYIVSVKKYYMNVHE